MSVVTFWSQGRGETGKTMSAVAIATYMAIKHNLKILLISTTVNNETIENCFWQKANRKEKLGFFGVKASGIETENGMEGLLKMVKSNKLTPELIKIFTKVVFKDAFEILISDNDEEDISEYFPQIISLANHAYDLVLVDLDSKIDKDIEKVILEKSDLVVANITQKLTSIDYFKKMKQSDPIFSSKRTITLVGKFDKFSKYTAKNISRYIGQKEQVLTIPYNTLFFEAAEEAGVPDLFLRLRNVGKDDRNWMFIEEIQRASDAIQDRLQTLRMEM